VDTYRAVLFIHLLGLLVATGAAGLIHFADRSMRSATTLSEAGRWCMTVKQASQAFPVAVVLLLGSGAYLVSDEWSWAAPWVLAALAGLGAIVAVGDAIMGRYGRRLGQAIGGTIARDGDGPITEEVARLLESRAAIAASFAPTLLMLGVVYVMTEKPGPAGSAAALLVATAVAAATGPALARRPEAAEAAPTAAVSGSEG
jgi:hypothetical protein